LVHLSEVFPDTSFWIDVICIDQDSPLERNHQVAQMRTIYSKAAEVIIWMGPEYPDTDRLSSFMESHYSSCTLLNDPVEGCELALDLELANAIQHLKAQPY
jgi:hypothetical protein